jgi:major membrane immunogen (membrane-anchored lipoprotein)
MKRLLTVGLVVFLLSLVLLTGCGGADAERAQKDAESDANGGLNRTVDVYDYNGKLIKSYEGKIDIDSSTDGAQRIKFDLNGKRHLIYNGIVIVDEK